MWNMRFVKLGGLEKRSWAAKSLATFLHIAKLLLSFPRKKFPPTWKAFQKKLSSWHFFPFHCTFNLMLLKSSVSAVRKASQLDSFKWIRGTKGGGKKGPNCVFPCTHMALPPTKWRTKITKLLQFAPFLNLEPGSYSMTKNTKLEQIGEFQFRNELISPEMWRGEGGNWIGRTATNTHGKGGGAMAKVAGWVMKGEETHWPIFTAVPKFNRQQQQKRIRA